MHHHLRYALGLALACIVSAPEAQDAASGDRGIELHPEPTAEVVPLSEWNYDELYRGWSVRALLGTPVRGPEGEEIGEAKNVLLDSRGKIVALIAEVGGVWNIGDTHVAVPWAEVERTATAVQIPVTEQVVDDYGVFANDSFFSTLDVGDVDAVAEDLRTGPRIWKATELLDDYVVIEPNEPYGYVSDLIFDDGGDLLSVVVSASNERVGKHGRYAYPWHRAGWLPRNGFYTVPYNREQIANLSVFDYERFEKVAD